MVRPVKVGRYLLFEAFAVGGTAQVHFGRLLGPAGFSRTFAIKRLHPHLAGNVDFTTMLLDEARLAARIRHPSVVSVFEVLQIAGELLLVMDWVDGVSLARLAKHTAARGETIPAAVAIGCMLDALAGLHAAHEARSDLGQRLEIVHRDVSPQNVLVGTDGLGRVLDFGIAHATERVQLTRTGEVKGKLEYLAPEQVRRTRVDRRTDVYAASVVLWELLTGTGLLAKLAAPDPSSPGWDLELLRAICRGIDEPPSRYNPRIPPELDAVVMRGLSPDPNDRFASATEFSRALEAAHPRAPTRDVVAFVRDVSGHELDAVTRRLARIEAYVPDGSEPCADNGVSGALDELFEVAPEPRRRPAPPAPVTATYTEQPPAPPPRSTPAVEAIAPSSLPDAPAVVVRSPSARRRPAMIALIALVVSGVLAIILVVRALSAPEPSVVAVEAPKRSLAAKPAVIVEPPEPIVKPPSIDAAPDASLRVAAPPIRAARARAPVSKPKPPQPDCSTPYVLDADGVRIPKRECFR